MNITTLLEELRAIALTGLHYNQKDPYNHERYERLLRLTANEYAALSGVDSDLLAEQLRREIGYITPKVGVCGAVFNQTGQVLLVRRSDNGRWALPGGYAEVNFTPQENLARELREETGLEVTVGELVDVYTAQPGQYPHVLQTTYTLMFRCTAVGGTLTPSHETPELGFFDHTTVDNWHMNHHLRAERAYALWQADGR